MRRSTRCLFSALRFDEAPITCETQKRYHSIAPCLAGKRSAEEQTDALGLTYSTVCRWLRQFREEGISGLFPSTDYPREPQTPERVIVALLYYKCCVPSASNRELARILNAAADHHIHLSEATIRKIMALNRRLHLAPQRPVTIIEPRDLLEGPKKSSLPFERIFIDLRYLDAKPAGVQLYSTLLSRLGEYHWERCRSVEEAVEFHRDLIRDHNRLPHWAHHCRNDGKHSPLAVLGNARGKRIEPTDLQRAFGQRYCQRMCAMSAPLRPFVLSLSETDDSIDDDLIQVLPRATVGVGRADDEAERVPSRRRARQDAG